MHSHADSVWARRGGRLRYEREDQDRNATLLDLPFLCWGEALRDDPNNSCEGE